MARRDEIVAYANGLLEIDRFSEWAPQGMQVVGAEDVASIACSVSCSREVFERAVEGGAQLVIVHHGMFWRNEPLVVDARLRGRLEALFRGNVSLLAYHLALDAHPTLGNNAQLAQRLDASVDRPFVTVGLGCTIEPVDLAMLTRRVEDVVGRPPLVLAGGDHEVTRLAICSGGSAPDLIQAAHEGYDALLTGEPAEPSASTARELGIHLIAAGHYATERFGVEALSSHVAERFGLDWRFIDVENPV